MAKKIKDVFEVWLPFKGSQRFGQFLDNAAVLAGRSIFYISDDALVEACEEYAKWLIERGNKNEA